MAVEAPGTINTLDQSQPTGDKLVSEGDDHIRLIKYDIKYTWPNVAGIINASHTEHNYLVGVTSLIQPQINLKAPNDSPALTGTPTAPTPALTDASGRLATVGTVNGYAATVSATYAPINSPTFTGIPRVPTAAVGTSGTQIASLDFVNGVAFAGTLPGQSGNALGLLQTDGTNASWQRFPVLAGDPTAPLGIATKQYADGAAVVGYSSKSANYNLVSSDKGKLIDAVGSITLTFDAAATLKAGWYAYIRNAGNGDVTLDPNGSETIDNALTYVSKPGSIDLIQCDGTAFRVVPIRRRTYTTPQLITTNTTVAFGPGEYVKRFYLVSAGSAGAAAGGGAGGGMAFGDIAGAPGDTVTIAFSAGNVTATKGGVTLLSAAPASGATPGTATRNAAVTNGNAYSGGARGPTGSGGASSGSPLGPGLSGALNGGSGWGGTSANNNAAGGAFSGASGGGSGAGFPITAIPTDPLLAYLIAPSMAANGEAGPGAGSFAGPGRGGFGAGGAASGNTAAGGAGGFGGGGGTSASGLSGAGGFGGGGGADISGGSQGAGGAAAAIVM